MSKVSVIIPVYNTSKYLNKCLDSVCNQTLKDIEIICINDCSADNSLEILKEYASKDERIKIIDFKENKGAAAARNAGIDIACGEYIGFVDSDDFVDLDFYEKLYNAAVENDADAAKGNYKDAASGLIDYNLNKKIEENKDNFVYAYCSAIFRRKIVEENTIRFPILKDMEDPVFTLKFTIQAKKILIVDTNINIVRRQNSATSSALTIEKLKDKLAGLKIIVNLENEYSKDPHSYCYVICFWFYETYFNSIKTQNKYLKEYLVKELFTIYDEIKHKTIFINMLKNRDDFFAKCVNEKSVKNLLNYSQAKLLYNLRKRLYANV